jgi:hypothetical protein
MRDIRDLVKRREKPDPPKVPTDDEVTRAMYLEDLARMRDFSPPATRMIWPSAIGPRWKN